MKKNNRKNKRRKRSAGVVAAVTAGLLAAVTVPATAVVATTDGGITGVQSSLDAAAQRVVALRRSLPAAAPATGGGPVGDGGAVSEVAVAPPGGGASGTPVSVQGTACTTAVTKAVEPFGQHMKLAHLERSVGDQISDIKATDQWVETHAELFKAMGAPVLEGSGSVAGGTLPPFLEHLKVAHIERGVPGQIEDISNADQWTKTHTVLVETMAAPAMAVLGGECGTPSPQAPEPMPMPGMPAPEPAPGSEAGGTTVMVHNNSFAPAEAKVGKGSTVTWTNMDTVPHTVTGDALKSGTLDKDATFSYTFPNPGTFSYYCAIHPDMKGTVVVG